MARPLQLQGPEMTSSRGAERIARINAVGPARAGRLAALANPAPPLAPPGRVRETATQALSAVARRGEVPARSILLRIRQGAKEASVQLAGGPNGMTVTDQPTPDE
jgi:hypothetical protein